jgi:hypothetical protein
MTSEEWRDVEGYEGYYRVSDQGRVWSSPRPRTRGGQLSPNPDSGGYQLVELCAHGTRWRVRVHVLVATAFHGPRPAGLVVRHLNDTPADNRAVNLKWGTVSENALDSVRRGTCPLLRANRDRRRGRAA